MKNSDNPSIPTPPDWLKGRALERWASLWPTLDRSRDDPVVHGDMVAAYCQCYSDWRDAIEKIATQGSLVKDHKDRVVANPYCEIRDNSLARMIELGAALGIKPDERLPRAGLRWDDISEALTTGDDS